MRKQFSQPYQLTSFQSAFEGYMTTIGANYESVISVTSQNNMEDQPTLKHGNVGDQTGKVMETLISEQTSEEIIHKAITGMPR